MTYMPSKCLRVGQKPKASVLILVLIVLASMVTLSAGLAYRTRIEMQLAHAYAQRTESYYLALGGIERVKALLSHEKLSPLTIAHLCRFHGTAKEEDLFEELEGLTDGKLVAYSLRDEQGYLNINKSDPGSWTNMDLGSKELCSSIVDWTDADDDTEPDGAETDFYQRLEPAHVAKNSPCAALRELILVRGVTQNIYTGEDLNRNSSLDENERDGQLQFPGDNEDNELDLGIVDIFTVHGDGRININTAPYHILSVLQGLDEEAADIILAYRAGPDGQFGTDDDTCFTSAEELAHVEGLTELQIELLPQYCCFDSEYFRIFSAASLDKTLRCCLMATAKSTENGIQILCFERLL